MTTLKEQCRTAIMSYADTDMQMNSALLGEHTEYVALVLMLFRDEYKLQSELGNTVFTIPTDVTEYLNSIKPY